MASEGYEQGSFLRVHVSFPEGSAPSNAGAWEAAIAKRIPSDLSVLVIVDGTPGAYAIRSAHSAHGTIADLSPDATRLLHEAGLI